MPDILRAGIWLALLVAVSSAASMEDDIDGYVRAEMELNSIPGIALAVVDGGGVVFQKAYGVRRVGEAEPMTVETLVELASVSKSLTAVGIVQLERDGRLSRDQPVVNYLPELGSRADSGWREVTVGHLLQHRSGLRRDEDFRVPCCGLPGEGDFDLAVTTIAEAPLQSPPGEVLSYANSNYILLAALIERVSRRPFSDFMQERVFGELGMTRTTLDRDRAQALGMAAPHERLWGRVRPSPSSFYGWPGASLVKASAADMGRYLMDLLASPNTGGPSVLGQDWWIGLERGYDLGWWVQTEAHWLDGMLALEHAGDIWGGNTAALLVPGRQAGAAVLTNVGTNRANRIARAVMRRVAGLEMPAPEPMPSLAFPDTWAMGFLAGSVVLLAGLVWYGVRFVPQWTAGTRQWSPTPWRIGRGVAMGILAVIPPYILLREAPPLVMFPSSIKLALPLLVFVSSAVLLTAGLAALVPTKRLEGSSDGAQSI